MKKRFVFPTSDEIQEFLHSLYDVEISRHFRVTSNPILVDVPGGKGLNFECELEPIHADFEVISVMKGLLESSLMDGHLRVWKGYLAPLNEFSPEGRPALAN